MEVVKLLDVGDIDSIVAKIEYRQQKWGEDLRMSIGVVLMNYGDSQVKVRCTNEEWEGTKKDLIRKSEGGIPLCPNGHPLFELTTAPKLALVEEDKNASI